VKEYGRVKAKLHAFLNTAPRDVDKLHAPAALRLEKRLQYLLKRRLSGPRIGLDAYENSLVPVSAICDTIYLSQTET
jgi:hypothetical protein